MYVCRLQFEKQFSDQIVEMKREREEEIRKINQQWQHRIEELQTQVTHTLSFLRPIIHTVHSVSCNFFYLHVQLEEKRALSEKMEVERERRYGNGEMERMKQEIQKTRDMNSTLRAQLHSTIQEKERLMRQQLQVRIHY